MNHIEENLSKIKTSLDSFKESGGDICLIAVSKTVGVESVEKAIECGVENFGENKVQELVKKYDVIGDRAKWHLIGSLQTNKVKYIIDKVELIHSLDRDSLAKEINKRAKDHEIVSNCLVQVNISKEDSKHGLDESQVVSFVKNISEKYGNIRIRGLMGMAPFLNDKQESRRYFRRLKELSKELEALNLKNISMDYLSMGMSNDYEIAVAEGSNMVRLGTSIFGARQYK